MTAASTTLAGYSTSNFDEPKPWSNYPSTIFGLLISFLILSWISAIGRLYTRFRILKAPGIDDLFVCLYLLTSTAGTIAICLAVTYGGMGQHFLLLTQAQVTFYLQAFYVGNGTYNCSTAFIKLALLFQYLKVYARNTWMHRLILASIVFTAMWGFSYSVIAWMPCIPVADFWNNPEIVRCYGYGSDVATEFVGTYESHTAVNLLLDLLVLGIPLPLLFNKHTGPAQRWRIVALILMGLLVIGIAIWRLKTIIDHQAATYPTHDPTWYGPITMVLAVLEVDVAAVCASIPIFWPALTSEWGRILVTNEIRITTEDRFNDDDQSALTAIDRHGGRAHSRTESTSPLSDLKRVSSSRSVARGKETHYQDSYILQQVDPFRGETLDAGHRVEASSSNRNHSKTRKWLSLR